MHYELRTKGSYKLRWKTTGKHLIQCATAHNGKEFPNRSVKDKLKETFTDLAYNLGI